MTTSSRTRTVIFALAMAASGPAAAFGQGASTALPAAANRAGNSSAATLPTLFLQHHIPGLALGPPAVSWELQPLVSFKESDIKFNLQSLMNTLRDSEHEGWVLAAYPDPKTSRPLIGAGFSLDVEGAPHPQRDPLNPYPFLEPSSGQLWQAAGLGPERLQTILDQFDRELEAWNKKKYRRKIRTHELTPQLSEADATRLLRISSIQAVHNARAYCRGFDQLSGPQQMALSQLVFQMGVNLEEFVQFLSAINETTASAAVSDPANDAQRWQNVQRTLIESDWARRYTTRAVSVIAMFDPDYERDPYQAESKVRIQIHPLVTHAHKRKRAAVRSASTTHKKTPHSVAKT